jgi:branched-chain amino acid transport system permease protein
MAAYQVYYVAFERRDDQSLRGLSFFFGILFIAEVGLIWASASTIARCRPGTPRETSNLFVIELPWRLLVPFLLGLLMVAVLQIFLSRTFIGRAIQAVAQDQGALRLMAANPAKIKRIAFGLSFATAAVAGAALIIIQPVEPSIGREYIGRIFAICCAGAARQLSGHGDRGGDPRHRREPDRDLLRTVLGAGGGVRRAARDLGGEAQWHPWSLRARNARQPRAWATSPSSRC